MQPRQHKTASFLSAHPVFWSAPNLSSAACKAKSALNCACSSGTFEDDDHVAGDSKRHEAAEVLFHQRQCETYPCGHASRSPHQTLADKDRIGLHAHGDDFHLSRSSD